MSTKMSTRTRRYQQIDFTQLMQDYNSGDEIKQRQAAETAVKALKGFVIATIKRYYPTYIRREFDDMLQSAYLGIIKSLPNYDPERSRPTTYFSKHIKQAIQLHLNMQENQSSVYYQTINNKIQKAVGKDASRQLDAEEIALETGISVKTIEKARAIAVGSQKYTYDEKIETEIQTYDSPEDALVSSDEKAMCYNYLSAVLSPTEMKVVCESFGIGGYDPVSTAQIAKTYHTKVEKIVAIQESAYEKLRTPEFAAIFRDGTCMPTKAVLLEDCELEAESEEPISSVAI